MYPLFQQGIHINLHRRCCKEISRPKGHVSLPEKQKVALEVNVVNVLYLLHSVGKAKTVHGFRPDLVQSF